MSYTLKTKPEDFIVNEIPVNFNFSEQGKFLIFKLIKKDYNTIKAIEILASFLGCKNKEIGFAGNKDRCAITSQYISINEFYKKRIEKFKHENITLEYIGKTCEFIRLGHLKGNNFEITINNATLKKEIKTHKSFNFINYFGEQRFSTHNEQIGKNLILKNYKKATELVLKSNLKNEVIKNYLSQNKNDYVGALSLLPKKLLTLFINSYQSYLWNICASKIFESEKKLIISGQKLSERENIQIPEQNQLEMIGFETDLDSSIYSEYLKSIMKEEAITNRDFILKQFNNLTPSGSKRKLITTSENLEIEKKENNQYIVSFFLEKGNYATVLLRFLFK